VIIATKNAIKDQLQDTSKESTQNMLINETTKEINDHCFWMPQDSLRIDFEYFLTFSQECIILCVLECMQIENINFFQLSPGISFHN